MLLHKQKSKILLKGKKEKKSLFFIGQTIPTAHK